MKSREFNPLRLDVGAFAEAGAELSGRWPLTDLERLAASAAADATPRPDEAVTWAVRGESRRRSGAAPELRLHLEAGALLRLECRRCLRPVETPLALAQTLRFVAGEEQAAALDAESDEDVLALSRALDLRELIEDELLLALPLAPHHAVCERPLPTATLAEPPDDAVPERPNPFAALAALKKPDSPH